MAAHDPKELHSLFAERASAGDLEGLIALYESGAAFVGPDGSLACGQGAIRERLRSLLAAAPAIASTGSQAIIADDVALVCSRWDMRFGTDDETESRIEGLSTEVARRQPDGTWLYLIDHPVIQVPAAANVTSDMS